MKLKFRSLPTYACMLLPFCSTVRTASGQSPRAVPAEATWQFRPVTGKTITWTAEGEGKGAPLLQCAFTLIEENSAEIQVACDGTPMITTDHSEPRYDVSLRKPLGKITYGWRFPRVSNLWPERDRCEVGAALESLAPFSNKIFTLRFVLDERSRQVWLDDRLVSQKVVDGPATIVFEVSDRASIVSETIQAARKSERYIPLSLANYSHEKTEQQKVSNGQLTSLAASAGVEVPFWLETAATAADLNLGLSLDRQRLSHGPGLKSRSVDAKTTWPDAFEVDPQRFSFRVPFKTYQNVWLLAWMDEKPNTVPKGVFRFYRVAAGFAASSEFEISEASLKSGQVRKTGRKNAAGKELYLVCAPVDTRSFYGFRDMADNFVEFEISKPVVLTRSYPDPMYYDVRPGGLESSIHIAGITLEEAPFDFEVSPGQFNHVFDSAGGIDYTVRVDNLQAKEAKAKVVVETKSYDGEEVTRSQKEVILPADQSTEAALTLNLKKMGWHELKVRVEGEGASRETMLSLVVLPPNDRTYGYAPNETRFGNWTLWGHRVQMDLLKEPQDKFNEPMLALLRRLGIRRTGPGALFLSEATIRKYDLLLKGPHTIVKVVYDFDEKNAEGKAKIVEAEVAAVKKQAQQCDRVSYYYGGEFPISKQIQYAPWPAYTGDGDRDFTPDEKAKLQHHYNIFTTVGKALRQQVPNAQLNLNWGAVAANIAYMRYGFPRELVDAFGMDSPQFELVPEISNAVGCLNGLWAVRQEAKRMGWNDLPINWCEGPFLPTLAGALSESKQADYQIRNWLVALSYGMDQFEAGIVLQDGADYYGAEHYGAGIFHRLPYNNPKPAVAAVATATSMLCGADVVGGVETGSLTTYCLAFKRADGPRFALWRVQGNATAKIRVEGDQAKLTDAMGNARILKAREGVVEVPVSSSPVWLTELKGIQNIQTGAPSYSDQPSPVSQLLSEMTSGNWKFSHDVSPHFETNSFAVRRVADPDLKVEFDLAEPGYSDAVGITLPEQPGDRPLANRYGTLTPKQPLQIPGKAKALGTWVKGNSSWGRIVYELKDAKGERWLSAGTRNAWNCDDPHGWSYVSFDGWKYLRFPLPGNLPYDSARELESTWWGSAEGDGIVDLPLTLEKIYVEARNEVPYLSTMTTIPERTWKLSQLVAEYASAEDRLPEAIVRNNIRKPVPQWNGPVDNPMAALSRSSIKGPQIRSFDEPNGNDGTSMIVRFDSEPSSAYNLYLSVYPDGRGAERIKADVKDGDLVKGLRPELPMYLFLTKLEAAGTESRPSEPYRLITHDNFAEK